MKQIRTFQQTNAFAMYYGVIFGLIWIFGFICFLKGYTSPILSLLFTGVMLAVPIIGVYLSIRFRKAIGANDFLPFGRAYLFSVLIYFYATILLSLTFYVYFQFIDTEGNFWNSCIGYYEQPEIKNILEQSSLSNNPLMQGMSLPEYLTMLKETSTIQLAAAILDSNILVGLILSLPTALISATWKIKK